MGLGLCVYFKEILNISGINKIEMCYILYKEIGSFMLLRLFYEFKFFLVDYSGIF